MRSIRRTYIYPTQVLIPTTVGVSGVGKTASEICRVAQRHGREEIQATRTYTLAFDDDLRSCMKRAGVDKEDSHFKDADGVQSAWSG